MKRLAAEDRPGVGRVAGSRGTSVESVGEVCLLETGEEVTRVSQGSGGVKVEEDAIRIRIYRLAVNGASAVSEGSASSTRRKW